MNNNIILFDFDGIYKAQNFYDNEKYKWLDLENMCGTNAYCDRCAQNILRNKLKDVKLPELSFIGSGNYHYVSLFLTEKIQEDFTLVVFDNHSDSQRPLFDELLSCGSWIRSAYKNEAHLRQIVLVGANEASLKEIDNVLKDKITVLPYDKLLKDKNWYFKLHESINYPVYISVDKDVFSKEVAQTNWDQGGMSLEEFLNAFKQITENHKVIGMDVCGECSSNYTDFLSYKKANNTNNIINKRLLELAEKVIA